MQYTINIWLNHWRPI